MKSDRVWRSWAAFQASALRRQSSNRTVATGKASAEPAATRCRNQAPERCDAAWVLNAESGKRLRKRRRLLRPRGSPPVSRANSCARRGIAKCALYLGARRWGTAAWRSSSTGRPVPPPWAACPGNRASARATAAHGPSRSESIGRTAACGRPSHPVRWKLRPRAFNAGHTARFLDVEAAAGRLRAWLARKRHAPCARRRRSLRQRPPRYRTSRRRRRVVVGRFILLRLYALRRHQLRLRRHHGHRHRLRRRCRH